MPEIQATHTRVDDVLGAYVIAWGPMQAIDRGAPIEMTNYADRSIQIIGTGKATIEGSNDGDNWAPLHDPQGIALSTLSAGIYQVSEFSRYIRPKSDQDGTTVIMATRRTNR